MTLRERENVVQISEEFGLKSSRLKTEQSRNFSLGCAGKPVERLWEISEYSVELSCVGWAKGRTCNERLSAGPGADNQKKQAEPNEKPTTPYEVIGFWFCGVSEISILK
jgi:hypothetical protein